jgi:quercetin dioxygenase-like cupin family protein
MLSILILAAAPSVFHGPPPHTLGKGVSVTELLPADAAVPERLALVQAQSDATLQLDPDVALVAVGARAFFGPAKRCDEPVTLKAGNQLWILRPTAGSGPLTRAVAKRECPGGAARLTPLEQKTRYELPVGAVEFIAQTPFAYAGLLELKPGAVVKPHRHEGSVEIVVLLRGSLKFVLDGAAHALVAGDVVRVAAALEHAVTVGPDGATAYQFYLPPGPEERFRGQPDAGAAADAGGR